MRSFKGIANHFRFIKSNTLIVASIFTLGLGVFGILGAASRDNAQALVRDCDANAIMNCGAADANEFRTKFNANAPGDLPAIYGHYWIPRDLQVVQGQAFRDGTVRVNGKVVATNAKSIGRQAIPGSRPISIAGKTYYETPNSVAFKTDGLPTMVALDAQGNFKYAVINACGNPIYATPVPPTPPTPPTPPQPPKETPKYSCTNLTIEHISNTQKKFTYSASATGGATVASYTVDFGDGTNENTTATSLEHTYANRTGTTTVRVTAKINVDGKTVDATGGNCVKSFEIKKPGEVACTALDVISKGSNKYDFTIRKTETNATYNGATMDYGDGQTEQISGTTASHQYAQAGNYTITATLRFNIDGNVKDVKCTAAIQPCEYDATLPKDSPDCQKPVTPAVVELPKTGPGQMVLGGLGIASVIVAVSFYAASRRDLLSALLDR